MLCLGGGIFFFSLSAGSATYTPTLTATSSPTPWYTPTPVTNHYSQRVVCVRSTPYTDIHDYTWAPDQAYTAGFWGYVIPGHATTFHDRIENTYDPSLYSYERWDTTRYQFDVPGPGKYYIKLLWAENFYGLPRNGGGIGSRIFDVWINGVRVLNNFDILAETGGRANRALLRSFEVQVPTEGPYTIEITSDKFNAIEISNQPTLTDTLDVYNLASPGKEEAFRINCGGTKSWDLDGTLWMADEAFSQCQRWGYVNGEAKIKVQTPWPSPEAYRLTTWREGGEDFKYQVSLPNGIYQVKLYFCENEYSAAGQRVFDVNVNGVSVATQLDVYAQKGMGQVLEVSSPITITQEHLEITFSHLTAGQAMLNALAVQVISVSDKAFLDFVERRSLDFFTCTESGFGTVNPTNGLILDRMHNFIPGSGDLSSITSVGFGLAAVAAGKIRGWINAKQAEEQIERTMQFFLQAQPYTGEEQNGLTHKNGFFFHFLNLSTGKRYGWCEISPIDTTLLLAGMLTAAGIFPGTQIETLAHAIFRRVNWSWFDDTNNQGFVANHWTPESGFSPWVWSGYNEDVLMDLLGLGAPDYPLAVGCWFNMTRAWHTYDGKSYMIELPDAPTALFTHLYPQCFLGLKYLPDDKNNYYENTALAARIDYAFCQNHASDFLSYAQGGWGLSAGDSPAQGYNYKAYLSQEGKHDGTVNPNMVAAAIPFASEIALPTLRHMYFQYKQFLWGRFGFANTYNLNAPRTYENVPSGRGWVAADVIGNDIGALVLGIENYRTGLIWNVFTSSEYIQRGILRSGLGSMLIDNFENDCNYSDSSLQRDALWWINHPEKVSLAVATEVAGNSTTCLKINYNKLMAAEAVQINLGQLSQAANMSYYLAPTKLSLRVYGNIELQFRFQDQDGQSSAPSHIFSLPAQHAWQRVTWDYPQLDWQTCNPRKINTILISILPGKTGSGEFYLDDIYLGNGPEDLPTATSTQVYSTLAVKAKEIMVYPNPAQDKVYYLFSLAEAKQVIIEWFNLNGERVSSLKENLNPIPGEVTRIIWNRHHLAHGLYFCHILIMDKEGKILLKQSKKVALQ